MTSTPSQPSLRPTGAIERLSTIASHELRTQLGGAPFRILLALLLAATSTINPVVMIPSGGAAIDGVRAVANSVHALAPTFAISAFFVYPFFVAMMAGLSLVRDDEAGVVELLQSTPLTTTEYLFGKLAGVLGTAAIAILIHLGIVMFFREAAIGGVARGPFDLSAYLVPVAFFVVPGVLWVSGLAFAIGARWRSPMAVYALPTALFVLNFMLLWNWRPAGIDPTVDLFLVLLDPTGLRWLSHELFATDRGLAFYNSAPLAIDSRLLWGRLVTITIPLLAIGAVVARARSRPALPTATRPADVSGAGLAPSVDRAFRALGDLPMTTVPTGLLRGTVTILAAELRGLSRQPSLYLFTLFLVAVIPEAGGGEPDPYGGTLLITAGGLAVRALPVVTLLVCLYLLFMLVEAMHRDRSTGFESIALSTPVPTAAMVAGRALAAGAVISVLTVACIAVSAFVVSSQQGATLELVPLLLVFVGVMGPTFILWTAFVAAVSSCTRSRTTALAIGFAALALTGARFASGSMTWLDNWPLWGALRWTEFAVFPLNGEALILNRLLALGLAALMLALAVAVLPRTERDPRRAAARRTPRRVALAALRMSPLMVLPVLTAGLLSVRIADGADGAARVEADRAYSELHGSRGVDGAIIRSVGLGVDLLPASRTVAVTGEYRLVNEGTAPMHGVTFTVPASFGDVAWAVDDAAAQSTVRAGLHEIPLAAALAVGDSRRIGFRYRAVIPSGYSRNGGGLGSFVLPVAVLLSTHRGDFLPIPGIDRSRVADLPLRPAARIENEPAAAFNQGERFTVRMTVRAPVTLTVNGIGDKVAERTSDGLTTTVWTTTTGVSAIDVVAGPYEAYRAAGVAVHALAEHGPAAAEMAATLAAARRHYSDWFSPFPWQELRLSEYPDLETQATSYPANITVSEGLGFLGASGPSGGLSFAVVSHEAAHQWWGHLLRVAEGPGTGLLVEGMADYSALLLHERVLGPGARIAFARRLEEEYLSGRSEHAEVPVVAAREGAGDGEAVLQKKGAWIMWMLHNEFGEEATFTALRRLFVTQRSRDIAATPVDLLLALRASAPDTLAFDRFARQWFADVVLPEFTVDFAHCEGSTGAWRCRARVRNVGSGQVTVEVAAFVGDRLLSAGRTRAALGPNGSADLLWTLAERPERIVVDPDVVMLQRNRDRATIRVPLPP